MKSFVVHEAVLSTPTNAVAVVAEVMATVAEVQAVVVGDGCVVKVGATAAQIVLPMDVLKPFWFWLTVVLENVAAIANPPTSG